MAVAAAAETRMTDRPTWVRTATVPVPRSLLHQVRDRNAPLPAPSPPLSAVGQPSANDHAFLHWTACYDDYCNAHRQMKDDNYYPQRGNDRHQRNHRPCSRPYPHPFELAEVIRNRHLNPRKACADWQKGKRVCPKCRFLVNMEEHHQSCQTTAQRTPVADIMPAPEEQELPGPIEENQEPHAAAAASTTSGKN